MQSKVIEQLKAQGFDVQGGKILSATPVRVSSLNAMGLRFVAIQDAKGKIVKRGWTAVTKAQANKLKDVVDPVTKECYLRFAYVPIPDEWLKQEEKKIVDKIDLNELNKRTSGVEEVEMEDPILSPPELRAAEEEKTEEMDKEFDRIQSDVETKLARGEELESTALKKEDKKLTSQELEREELKGKTVEELKAIILEIGLEVPSQTSKEELIELIAG